MIDDALLSLVTAIQEKQKHAKRSHAYYDADDDTCDGSA